VEPVSTSEFQQAIGEIRRRGDERHQENIQRFQALEQEFRAHAKEDILAIARIDKSISHNTDLTRASLNASNEAKRVGQETAAEITSSIKPLLDFATGVRQAKRALIVTASVVVAATAIFSAIMYVIGKGPLPGIHL